MSTPNAPKHVKLQMSADGGRVKPDTNQGHGYGRYQIAFDQQISNCEFDPTRFHYVDGNLEHSQTPRCRFNNTQASIPKNPCAPVRPTHTLTPKHVELKMSANGGRVEPDSNQGHGFGRYRCFMCVRVKFHSTVVRMFLAESRWRPSPDRVPAATPR